VKGRLVAHRPSNIALCILVVASVFLPHSLFALSPPPPQVELETRLVTISTSALEDLGLVLECQPRLHPSPPSSPPCEGVITFAGPDGTPSFTSTTFIVPAGGSTSINFLGSSIPSSLFDSTGHALISVLATTLDQEPARCQLRSDIPILRPLLQLFDHTSGQSELALSITPRSICQPHPPFAPSPPPPGTHVETRVAVRTTAAEDIVLVLECQIPSYPPRPSSSPCAGGVTFTGPDGTPSINSTTFTVPAGGSTSINLLGSSIPPSLFDSTGHALVSVLATLDEPEKCPPVPLLSDIPVLGALFQLQDHASGKSELMVFLTPRVICGEP
jgi:type II/III secretion system protein